jgi:hypothetical protein
MPNLEENAAQVIQVLREERRKGNLLPSSKNQNFTRVMFFAQLITALLFYVPIFPTIARLIGGGIFVLLLIISFLLWIPDLMRALREIGNPADMILEGIQSQIKSSASLMSRLETFELYILEFAKNQYDAALKRSAIRIDLLAGPLDKIGLIPFIASIVITVTKIPELLQQFKGVIPVSNEISSFITGGIIGVGILYPFLMTLRMETVTLEFESKALEEAIRRKKENIKSIP